MVEAGPSPQALYKRRYRALNAERMRAQARERWARNLEKNREYQRAWCANNREKRKQYGETARVKYADKLKAKAVSPEARQYLNAYRKRRFANDPNYKLRFNLRRRLNLALRRQLAKKGGGTLDLLGCSVESFKLYLESKFEPGMSWDNYGTHGWHVDHIMPLALFDLTRPEHQKRAFHYSNMQPLFAAENMSKGARLL